MPCQSHSSKRSLATAAITLAVLAIVSLANSQPYGPGEGPAMMGWGRSDRSAWSAGFSALLSWSGPLPGLRVPRTITRMSSSRRTTKRVRPSAALAALDQRYARGEISREDYLQRRRDFVA